MKLDQHSNANETLTDLYEQAGRVELPAWLDADTLVAWLDGDLSPALSERVDAAVGASAPLAALCDSLRELAPQAGQLEQALQTGATPVAAAHHASQRHAPARAHRPHQHAVAARRRGRGVRWLGGVAAAALLVAVAGIGGWQLSQPDQAPVVAQQAPGAASSADQIFDGDMDGTLAANTKPSAQADHIFRTSFSRTSS